MPPLHKWGLSVLNLSDNMEENFDNIEVEVVDCYQGLGAEIERDENIANETICHSYFPNKLLYVY